MKNILFHKVLENNQQTGHKVELYLTEEVNRIILWKIIWEGEDDEMIVIRTFREYAKDEAIEVAVRFATKQETAKAELLIQRIVRHVSGRVWNADAMVRVVQELRASGYSVLDLEGT